MFGRSRPIVFDPYRGRRRRGALPRWLWLLLLGAAAGAGGVIYVDQRVLPPRLSMQATADLRSSFEKAESERLRLQAELGSTASRLDAALAEKQRLGAELGASRDTAATLSRDLAAVVDALPPDPRGGSVEVRAGRFSASGGQLHYELVLTREAARGKPLSGVVQLMLEGERGSVAAAPLQLSLLEHQVLRGRQALPDGFRPRQATVEVLDRAGGKALGRRVLLVRGDAG